MPLLFNDTFDGSSVALESHLSNTAQAWSKHPLFAGSMVTTGGGFARPSALGQDARYLAGVSPATADYTITAIIKMLGTTAQGLWVAARHDAAADTCYYVEWQPHLSTVRLVKRVAGVDTELGTYAFVNVRNASFTIVFDCFNALKTVKVNGVTAITSADNAITAAGRPLMRELCGSPGAISDVSSFDSFVVSDATTDTTPPPAPTGPAAVAKIASADVSWALVADVGGVVKQYRIETKKTSDGAGLWAETNTAVATSTTKRVHNLTPGISYDFRIRAEDESGNLGAYSATVAATPAAAGAVPAGHNDLTSSAASGTPDQAGLMLGSDTGRSFNGTSDSVRFAADPMVAMSAAGDVSCVMRPTSLPAAGVARTLISAPGMCSLKVRGPADLEATFVIGGVARTVLASAGLVAGKIYDVGASYDGAAIQLYVNGVALGAPLAVTGAIGAMTGPLDIGAANGAEFFAGTIKDVLLLGEARAPERILADYAEVQPVAAVGSYWGILRR